MSCAIVGALACQRDSYLRTFVSKVVSCKEVPAPKPAGGKKKKKKKQAKGAEDDEKPVEKLWEVETEDTVLFPEGGGQPTDTGFFEVNGEKIPVKEVKREGLTAVHMVPAPVDVGSDVKMEVNWARRFDHMQQHTGQHLLSALLDKRELPTLGWNLGEQINYIELPRKLSDSEIEDVSQEVNECITKAIPIHVETPDKDDVNKTKMPDDYDIENGVLRVVHIGELDANPCCGTHLSSTAQIKGIALLNQVSARGGNSRLNFMAGDRIIQYARDSHAVLKSLMGTLSCQSEEIPDKATSLTKEVKKLQSRENNLMRELADLKVQELRRELAEKQFVYMHRRDGDLQYISHIYKQLTMASEEADKLGEDKTVCLLTGDNHEPGAVIVFGSDVDGVVKGLKESLSTLKGGGKGKFQGKVGSYEKGEIDAVTKFLEDYHI